MRSDRHAQAITFYSYIALKHLLPNLVSFYHELTQIVIFRIVLQFTDCQCMNSNATEAYPGSCKDDCEDSGFWYIALFSLFVFIHSTSEVGSMLLILRCVHPQDKAMALGLIQFAIGLFGKSIWWPKPFEASI